MTISSPLSLKRSWQTRLGIWSVVILGVSGSVFGVAQLAKEKSKSEFSVAGAEASGGWSRGNETAKVTLIEFSDFQCPACAAYEPMVKQALDEFGGQIRFVYRHFPLSKIHVNAEEAARAAEAAGLQGKFWEMHDLLFEQQSAWARASDGQAAMRDLASILQLDLNRFAADFDSRETRDRVREDQKEGEKWGVDATPTFFLNGQRLAPFRAYDDFRAAIQRAIAETP
ncbi:DsbA family protein [Candidatus Uhrbacteria bacterium]|nr:DsbA family protein [Candidatus Uhrbacteria bacterium]